MTNPPNDPPMSANILVAGRYRLLEPIARGGVAWVWRAHDETLDRAVAIKIVRADADPSLTDRLRAEAQAAAKVRHTGVISVFDTGLHDGVPFIAMELIEGETLRDLLTREGRLDPVRATTIIHHVAAALDALHRAGLVHGDIKPANIMLTADGFPKITDLGLARAAWQRGTDADDAVYGTPGYLAPERRHGARGDARADIYALGVVLFELLTGSPPPEGDIPWATTVEPTVSEELAAVVARATEHDPVLRYPSAGAMALQLAGAAPTGGTETAMFDPTERETTLLRPPPAAIPRAPRTRGIEIAGRRIRRRHLLAAGLASTLLVWLVAFGPINRTAVPELTGLTQTEAESLLDAAGLGVDLDLVYDRTVSAGIVIAQDPLADASLRRGRPVTLTVSLGPRLIEVPDVEGLDPDDARALLSSEGFTQILEREGFSDVVEVGLTYGTDPPVGQEVDAEEPLTILVSTGPETVTIPAVEDLSERDAKLRIVDTGLRVKVVREASRIVEEGIAIRTDPAAGSSARRETVITLVVSSGKPLVEVPSLRCMSDDQAEDALAIRGLEMDKNGKGKRVVDQEPAPGTKVREGSTVNVFMGFGAFCRGNDD